MRIEEILADPVTSLVRMERYVNDGSPSGFAFGEHQVTAEHRPHEGQGSFSLPAVRVDAADADVWMARPAAAVADFVLRAPGVVFCFHPDMAHLAAPAGGDERYVAEPTSSARTVWLRDAGIFVKLHYDGVIGRVPRQLTRKRVRTSLEFSGELDRLARAGRLGGHFAFLPESAGVALELEGSEVGMICREATPRPLLGGARSLVPMFSLFSADRTDPGHRPILWQLLDAEDAPGQWFHETLVASILSAYFATALGAGLIPENHAQNMLVELDAAGGLGRIVHRDLLDFTADLEIRRARGMPAEFLRTIDVAAAPERGFGWRSYAYDFRLGEYVLDPLAESFARYAGQEVARVKAAIREAALAGFAAHGVDPRDYFNPVDTVYFYPKVREIWRDGAPAFDTRPGPTYR